MLAPGARIVAPNNGGSNISSLGTSHATAHASAVGLLVQQAAENPLSDTLTGTPPTQTSPFRDAMRFGAASTTDSNGNLMPFPLVRINAFTGVSSILPDGQNPYSATPPPHNDLFPGHLIPYVAAGVPVEYIQDPFGATTSPTDPVGSQLCGKTGINNTVWFQYINNGSPQRMAISTTDSTYDPVIGVYTGSLGSLSLVTCNDEISMFNITSAVNFTADTGISYYIMVANTWTSLINPSGLHLWISASATNNPVEAGDTLALFGAGNGNASSLYGTALPNIIVYANLIDTQLDSPSIVNYATYPIGYPAGVANTTQWVMGDWDGDGDDTPGFYAPNGVFYTTNITGTVNGVGQAVWQGTWFGLLSGVVGNFAVAGRFDASVGHDCVGVVDSGNFPPYGVAFAMYFTCDFSVPNPPKTYQWLSVLLPDSQGFSGPFEFEAGDFGRFDNPSNLGQADWIDTIAVRRSDRIAFTNTPPTTISSAFASAQYFPDPCAGSSHFVVGDWDTDNVNDSTDINGTDSFGLYCPSGSFYYRNNLDWNTPPIYSQTGIDERITVVGVTSWRRN